jgi:hypothetical protein
LTEAGADSVFDTGDDVSYTVVPTYDDDSRTVRLLVSAPVSILTDGSYRLTLDGDNTIEDPAGNPIGGGSDVTLAFAIAPKSEVVAIEATEQLDVRSDGTSVMVSSYNPSIGGYKWPQVMGGQYGIGGNAEGPYRSMPTDRYSFGAVNSDVALNEAGGVVVYADKMYLWYPIDWEYYVRFQMMDIDGRSVGPIHEVDSVLGVPYSRVDTNSLGAFAVAYRTLDISSGDHFVLKGRLFEASGDPLGPAFTVSQQEIGRSAHPSKS